MANEDKERESRITQWINTHCSFFTSPKFTTIVSLILVVTGGIGSIWSTEIGRALPFAWPGWLPWNWDFCWRAFVFWCLLALSAAVLYLRQAGSNFRRELAEERLTNSAKELENLIRTTPPRHFLENAATLFNKSAKVLEASEACQEDGKLAEYIQRQLRMLATLVELFDGAAKNEEYSANIMLYRKIDEVDNSQADRLKEKMRSFGKDLASGSLQGWLELCPALSAASESGNRRAKGPPEIALPILKEPHSEKHGYSILPGAPLAWHEKRTYVCTDTRRLPDWCDKQNFKPEDVESFRVYLKSMEPCFQSFASIPLFELDQTGENNMEGVPIAVLNIQRKSPGLLGGRLQGVGELAREHHQQGFLWTARPFIVGLVKMLSRYRELVGRHIGADRRGNDRGVN